MRKALITVMAILVLLAIPSQAATATRPRQSLGSGAAYGGSLATFWGSTPYSEYCGLAFPWKTASGYHRWVTAGHCGAEGHRVNYTKAGSSYMGGYISKSGSYKMGNGYDMALLTPTYTPKAYVYRGGKTTTTLSAIKGVQTNYRGLSGICISGAYRGEFCGWKIVAIEGIQDQQGHFLGNEWKMVRSGSCPVGPGDSGSPFFVRVTGGVKITGLLSGMRNSSTACTLYQVGWEKVRAMWGGSVMTA